MSAVVLDLLFGDPEWRVHPVRLIGYAIAYGDRSLHTGFPRADLLRGACLTASLIGATLLITWGAIAAARHVSSYAGALLAVVLAWTTLSARGLDDAARRVEHAIAREDLSAARSAIRALVGRDPDSLDRTGLIAGAIESLAENLSDGFVAPLFFLAVAGASGAMTYKAINTLDSMIGYRDERYLYFGRIAARLDDVANLIPSRLAAVAITAAAALITARPRQSLSAWFADARKHESPNAGYPEAAMAGALGVQLGGDAYYAGILEHRARLGSPERAIDLKALASARHITWAAGAIALIVMLSLRQALAYM